jgi:hypothetical protein
MPITRRRRANPPEQPEQNNHSAESTEQVAETLRGEANAAQGSRPESVGPTEVTGAAGTAGTAGNTQAEATPPTPPVMPGSSNGDWRDHQEYMPPAPPLQQTPSQSEGGRRTARGELFRRPPQPPLPAQAAYASPAPLQAPTHEITLPLGNLLHLAYNPGYTGSDEARSLLLKRLSDETKAGGRARCWNCGSLAIAYDRWNTRSRTFGEIGIAVCEICGVWSVM